MMRTPISSTARRKPGAWRKRVDWQKPGLRALMMTGSFGAISEASCLTTKTSNSFDRLYRSSFMFSFPLNASKMLGWCRSANFAYSSERQPLGRILPMQVHHLKDPRTKRCASEDTTTSLGSTLNLAAVFLMTGSRSRAIKKVDTTLMAMVLSNRPSHST